MSFKLDEIKYENSIWWSDMRTQYNLGLIISGVISFLLYVFVLEFIVPKSNKINPSEVEITLFTIFFQGIFYIIAMIFANIIYWIISKMNNRSTIKNRLKAYNIYYWFSCSLPFLIPLLLFFYYV